MGGSVIILSLALVQVTSSTTVRTPPPVYKGASPTSFDPSNLSDAQYCTLMSGAADRANANMPMSSGTEVQATRIAVDCKSRTHSSSYLVASEFSAMRKDWLPAIQARNSAAVCSGPLTSPMAQRGWRFISIFTFKGGQQKTISANCKK
jgi:hypothetical protein